MPVVRCPRPNCGQKSRVEKPGTVVRCPACKEKFVFEAESDVSVGKAVISKPAPVVVPDSPLVPDPAPAGFAFPVPTFAGGSGPADEDFSDLGEFVAPPSRRPEQESTMKPSAGPTILHTARQPGGNPTPFPVPAPGVVAASPAATLMFPPSGEVVSPAPTGPAATLMFPPAGSDPTPAPASPAATLMFPPAAATPPSGPAATLTFPSTPVPMPSGNPVQTLTFPQRPRASADPAATLDAPTFNFPANQAPAIPKQLGRFAILGMLGQGAFGVVYRARDTQLDREVALKVAKPNALNTEDRVKRFLREAKAAANLRHPNIVPVFDSGWDGRHHYIASAFIAGEPLSSAIESPTGRKGISPRRAAEIVRKIADALHYAHGRGVIHRDVKPGNVMLDETDEPLLLDFGLAARLEGDEKLTQEAVVMGTPAYMAPEQTTGQATASSDQYSLGCTLFELLTAQTPYSGPPEIQILQHQIQEPPSPRAINRSIPRDLNTIVLKTLAKDPAKRYATTGDLAQDLQRFLAGEPIKAKAESRARKLLRGLKKRKALVAGVAASIVAILAVAFGLLREQDSRTRAVLQSEIQAGLRAPASEWTVDHVTRLEKQAAELRALTHTEKCPYHEVICEGYASAVREMIDRPRLEPEDIKRVEANLAGLTGRVPETEIQRLKRALQQRLRSWETVADVRPPFSALATTLPANAITIQGGTLRPAPAAEPEKAPLVLPTKLRSTGSVQATATFPDINLRVGLLGVAVNAIDDKRSGYSVVLAANRAIVARKVDTDPIIEREHDAPKLPLEPDSGTLAGVVRLGGKFFLQIRRDGMCLREIEVELPPSRPVTLRIRREENRIEAQLGSQPPIEILDTFPIPPHTGSFAVVWPQGVPLTEFRAEKLSLPPRPSPLEEADSLYAAGKFDEAVRAYQAQAKSTDRLLSQEARFKAGQCLRELKRDTDATAMFATVAGEDGPRWPPLASCEMWILHLRNKEFDQAEGVLTSLSARYKFEDLLSFLPEETRQSIADRYMRLTAMQFNVLIPDPNLVPSLERAKRALESLQAPGSDLAAVHFGLARAYILAKDSKNALRVQQEWIDRCDKVPGAMEKVTLAGGVLPDYAWLLRTQGQHAKAATVMSKWIALANSVPASAAPETFPTTICAIRLERARANTALGKSKEVENDVNACLALAALGRLRYPLYAQTYLLHGHLCLRKNDEAGAKSAWRKGTYTVYAGHKPQRSLDNLTSEIDNLALSALSDTLSDEDADDRLDLLISLASRITQTAAIAKMLKEQIPPGALRRMWLTTAGREAARKLAFREYDFANHGLTPVRLLFCEAVRGGAFAGALTETQETIVLQTFDRGWQAYTTRSGGFGKKEIAFLGSAWQGNSGFFGWGSVEKQLKPDIRGPLAYILGHRYLRFAEKESENPQKAESLRKDAEKMFRTALEFAADGSPLKQLAQESLEARN